MGVEVSDRYSYEELGGHGGLAVPLGLRFHFGLWGHIVNMTIFSLFFQCNEPAAGLNWKYSFIGGVILIQNFETKSRIYSYSMAFCLT